MADPEPSAALGWILSAGLLVERLVKAWREWKSGAAADEQQDADERKRAREDSEAVFRRALAMMERYEVEIRDLRARHREQLEEMQADCDAMRSERDSYLTMVRKRDRQTHSADGCTGTHSIESRAE